MTQSINPEPTLADVVFSIQELSGKVDRLAIDLEKAENRFDVYVKASEKVERIATTIIITAGTVTLLSPVLQTIAPAVRAFLGDSA